MRLSYSIVTLLVLSALVFPRVSADVVTEATVSGGYQGNLFNDSNSTGDVYASAGLELKYYPSSVTQIAAGAMYNAFSKYGDLSNLTGDLSFTIIPIPASSPISLTLTGAVAVRRFGQLYKLYDQVGATADVIISYRLSSWAYWQSSVSYLNTSYIESDYASNHGVDFSTGANFTVLGSNSITLKAEYSHRSFDQPTLIQGDSGYTIANSQVNSEMFEIMGFLLRYSRPLGEKTGINLSAGHRQLHLDNDYAVLGYTVDYLSPWSNLWEGTSLSGGLKHILPKQVIAELSLAYYDKNYVDVIELSDDTSEKYWQDARYDQLTTLSLAISRSISLESGTMITPSIHLGYRKNQSSTGFFDYEDIQASFSLKTTF